MGAVCDPEISRPAANERREALDHGFDIGSLLTAGKDTNVILETVNGLGGDRDEAALEMKTQEPKPDPGGHDGRLVGMKHESEVSKGLATQSQGGLRLISGAAQDNEVIGVPDDAQALGLDSSIETIEHQIHDHRGEDATLRDTPLGDPDVAILIDTGFEVGLHQVKDASVSNALGNAGHRDIVGNVIEAAFNVRIDHVAETRLEVVFNGRDGIVR